MSYLSNLESFANTEKFFRKAVDNGGISDVVRLPHIGNLPLRFQKTVHQEKSSLVRNEIRILEHCTEKKLNRVVAMFDYDQKLSLQQIITESAGVDLSKWCDTKVKITNEYTVISDIFYNPLFLIATLKNSLLALQQIHKNDIIHCDIKLDNICLPFDGYDLEKGRVFKPLFDNISLIDFGHSHWIGNPLGNSQRYWLGYIENEHERYQSKYLIGILKQYAKDNLYKNEKYNNSSLDLINYSCDLYGLGIAFKSLDNRMLSQYSQALKSNPWALIWQDYQSIMHQLLSYDNGIPSNEKSLPHQSLINKTELLIDKLERYMEYCYQDVKLQFVINDTQQIPIANSTQKLQSDTPISGLGASNDDLEIENDRVQEELSFWKYIVSKNTISGYTEYVAKYPKGNFVGEANKKILELIKLEDEQEVELWKEVCATNTINAYNRYLKISKKRKFVLEAKRSIADLERRSEENALWNKALASNSIEIYKEYLKKYPKGMYIKTANDRILEILDNQEIELWNAISEKDKISGYEEYLNKYPDGKYLQMVKDRIAYLKQRESQKQSQKNLSSCTKNADIKSDNQSKNNKIKKAEKKLSNQEITPKTTSENQGLPIYYQVLSILLFLTIIGIPGFFASLWSDYGFSSLMLTTENSFFEDLKNFGFLGLFYLLLIKPLLMIFGLLICFLCLYEGLKSVKKKNIDWILASIFGVPVAIIIVGSVIQDLSYWGAFFIVLIPLLLSLAPLEFIKKDSYFIAGVLFISIIWLGVGYMGYKYTINNPKVSRPLGNYVVDNQSGVVIDKDNNLVWSMCALGQEWNGYRCIYQPIRFSVDDREQAMNKLNEKNQDKNYWRLPTIEELNTLIKRECVVIYDSSPTKISTDLWYRPNLKVGGTGCDYGNIVWQDIFDFEDMPSSLTFLSSTENWSIDFYSGYIGNQYQGFIRPIHRLQKGESYDNSISLDTKQFSRIPLLNGKATIIFESNDLVPLNNIIYMGGISEKSLDDVNTRVFKYMLLQVSNGNKIETRKMESKRYYAVPEDKLEQSIVKILKNSHFVHYDEKTGNIVYKKQK